MTAWPADARDLLQRQLTDLAAAGPGRWSFAVHEDGDVIVDVDADVVQHPASTIKVPIMTVVLLEVVAGKCSLDDLVPVQPPGERFGGSGVLQVLPSVTSLTVAETVELMIIVSDNAATNMLIDLLGYDRIRDGYAELGLGHTRTERHINDVEAAGRGLRMETSAGDLARLLDRLGAGELFPDDLTVWALEVLGRQQFDSLLPARLDAREIMVRHKTGGIEGVNHDVGILEFDGRRITVAALGRELPLPGQSFAAADVISRAASLVVEAARG